MSRSNPTAGGAPNPATRWYEWAGDTGAVRYYDKQTKANVEIALPFTFLLLDELASVRGWHEASKSGIYSNEVRDTRQDLITVRSFKAGIIAQGLYKDIKDRANAAGGHFVSNCYIAFKPNGSGLAIGSLRFKGAALGAWMEFRKANRGELFSKAIKITGSTYGKKGKVEFYTPVFELATPSAETARIALELDAALQEFLKVNLGKLPTPPADAAPAEPDRDYDPAEDVPEYVHDTSEFVENDDSIPF